jgi:CLIP-associating protein 1/2
MSSIEPLYAHTQRELDEIFREMHQYFEGKESEQNWIQRDKSILKLRRLLKGNAPSDFLLAFVAGIRALLDGIIKAVNSLRTTMSTNACQLIQELARTLGPAMDPTVEILLQNFIKMTAATKQISANNGNVTVDTIFQNVSYSHRLLQHVWIACQDKNVQPRTFAAGWLKTLIKKHSPHKAHFESSGGLDIAEKCLKKGLTDANPKTRENMRATYFTFAQVWPNRAEL